MFSIQSLGGVRIEDSFGHTIRLRSRKHVALLLYLTAGGRRVYTRDALARLLWETSIERARHSLSQAVYDLRKKLPGAIASANADAVHIAPSVIRLDALELERAVKDDDLARAVELFRGPFADNLINVGSDDFERWLESERNRIARLGEMALRRYVRRCDEAAQWGEMCVAALRLVRLSHLDEEGHRALMRGLWLHGDAASAIRHFEEVVTPLERELPGGVSAETLRLVQRIRSTPAPEPWVDDLGEILTPFLGREAEMEILRTAVRDISRNTTTAMLVSGEAGIGKTRLVDEFTRSVALDNVRLLESRCYPAEAEVPYGPVIDGLRPVASDIARRPARELESFTRIGHLLPEFEPLIRDTEERVDPAAWRRRLYEEVTGLVRVAVSEQPIVWVIEDVQWMDATSTSLLHYLTRRLDGYPFLLIATLRVARGTELPEALPLPRPVESELSYEVRLAPLSEEQIGEILHRAAPDPVLETALQLAQRLSGGNPLYALEAFRAAAGSTEWAAEASSWDPLTDARLSKVLAVRLKGLSRPAMTLLQAAAVLERQATPGAVAAISGLTLREASEAAVDPYGRGLLQDRDGLLDFVNDIMREYVYAGMTALSRTALHLTAAEYLEEDSDANAATLARHFHLGEDRRRTYRYAMQAAGEAKAAAGQMEASAMADLAVRNSHGKEERLAALHLLAEAELESAQLPRAREHLDEILRLDVDMPPEQKVDVKLKLVEALAEAAEWSEARNAIDAISQLLERITDKDISIRVQAEALYWTLKVSTRQNDSAGALDAAKVAEELAATAIRDASIDSSARAKAVLSLATYAAFYESSERALSLLDEIRSLMPSLDQETAERVSLVRGTVSIRMARWDEGEHEFQLALQHATRRNDLVQQAGLWNNLACAALEQGDWDRFARWAGKVEEVSVCETLDTLLLLTLNKANALFYQGKAAAASTSFRKALDWVQNSGSLEFLPEVLSCQGLISLQLGDVDGAMRAWREVLNTRPNQLQGPQELFKYEWFRGFMGNRLGLTGTLDRLAEAAEDQARLDLLSHYKLLWLGSVLFGEDFNVLTNYTSDRIRKLLFENRLGWFAGFAQRWARSAAAKCSKLNQHRHAD